MIELTKIFKKFVLIIIIPFLLIITGLSIYNMYKFNNLAIKYNEYNTYYLSLTLRQQKQIELLKDLLEQKNEHDKMNTAKYYAETWRKYEMLLLCHAAETNKKKYE